MSIYLVEIHSAPWKFGMQLTELWLNHLISWRRTFLRLQWIWSMVSYTRLV